MELQHILADACAMQLVRNPKQFDVIVCDNLFGDMLSDEAAMLTGSIGMLPSASLGAPDAKTGKRKALYEPVHGSAPDIAGKGLANPIAAIASYGMALRYSYGLAKEADLIDKAIAGALAPRPAHRRHHAAQHAQGRHRRDGQGDPGGAGEAGGSMNVKRLPDSAHERQSETLVRRRLPRDAGAGALRPSAPFPTAASRSCST